MRRKELAIQHGAASADLDSAASEFEVASDAANAGLDVEAFEAAQEELEELDRQARALDAQVKFHVNRPSF